MIYEYVCSDCQSKFDVYATLAEKEKGLKPECPNCHSQKTIQVFGSFATFSRDTEGGSGFSSMPGCGPVCGPGTC